LFALENKTSKEAALLGFGAGFLGNIGVMYWVTHSVYFYGGVPLPLSLLAMLLLVAYLACYFAAFASVAAIFLSKRLGFSPCALAALWVALEYVRANVLSGFPWENIGNSQAAALPVAQLADITGVYGISFLIVFFNTALFTFIKTPRYSVKIIHITSACLLLAVTLGYGFQRLGVVERALANSTERALPIALLQGNIPQDIKWTPSYRLATIQKYRELARQRELKNGLMIFPEAAMPFFLQEKGIYRTLALGIVQEAKAWGLMGALAYNDDLRVTNSAFVVSPDGELKARYDKVKLVPFGEYVPRYVPFFRSLAALSGDTESGKGFSPLPIGGVSAGILICYEAIFPEIARAYAQQDVDVLINITNDGWLGRTSAPYQHLDMAVMRAIETRRYLLRAANTGISAIITPSGRISARTGIFVDASLAAMIRPFKMETFYTRYGEWVVYACFVLLTLCLAWMFKKGYER